MNLIRAALLFLCIVLTPYGLFAQEENPINRNVLFEVGFKQFPFAIEFAVQSPEFLAQLPPKEKDQFLKIASVAESISYNDTWGNSFERLDGFQSQAPKALRLRFSQNPEEFKLKPKEPLRLAKTTEVYSDDISVNELYLNSKGFDPTYIYVLQTLFHEVAHKIRGEHDQEAIDSVGAKWIQFLRPYYQISEVADVDHPHKKVRVEILSLPQKYAYRQYGGSTWSTKMIINENGLIDYHTLDDRFVADSLRRFNGDENGAGNVQDELTVRITNLKVVRAIGFHADIDLNLEIRYRLLKEGRTMYPAGVVANYGDPLGPQFVKMQSRQDDLIPPSSLNVLASTSVNRPHMWGSSRFHPTAQTYHPRLEAWDYQNSTSQFKISNVAQAATEIRLAIQSKQNLKTAQLRLQSERASFLVEGRKISEAGAQSQWQFQLPKELSSANGEVKIRDVVLNNQFRSLLPEILTHKVPQAPSAANSMSMSKASLFDGKAWIAYKNDIIEIPEGAARMRVEVAAETTPAQFRLRWNSAASIFLAQENLIAGTVSTIHEEPIQNFKLVETKEGRSTYEFFSRGALKYLAPTTADLVTTADSGRRYLKEIHVVSNKMESSEIIFTEYLRIFNREYVSVKPRRTGVGIKCEALF